MRERAMGAEKKCEKKKVGQGMVHGGIFGVINVGPAFLTRGRGWFKLGQF
jgi:hypothetical protein